jgi:hypothetical protein
VQISGNRGYPVTQTLADLIQAAQDLSPVAVSTDEAVLTLVDLSGIVSRIGDLADQLRMLLADRPPSPRTCSRPGSRRGGCDARWTTGRANQLGRRDVAAPCARNTTRPQRPPGVELIDDEQGATPSGSPPLGDGRRGQASLPRGPDAHRDIRPVTAGRRRGRVALCAR